MLKVNRFMIEYANNIIKTLEEKKNIIPENEWNAYYKSIDAIINDYRVGRCTRYETMRLLSGHDEEISTYIPD